MGIELEKLREIESRKREVMSDGKLSQEGRRVRIDEINNEKNAYYPKAVSGMKASVEIAKDAFRQAEKKLSDAYDKSEQAWNFERLNYYSRQVSGELRRAVNVMEADKVYQGFRNSPDKHIKRVASESVDAVASRFGADASELITRMKADKTELLRSKEIDDAEKDAEQVASRLVGLANEVRTVSEFYKPDGFPGGKNEFDDVLAGVQIVSKVDASSPDKFEKITVSIDE